MTTTSRHKTDLPFTPPSGGANRSARAYAGKHGHILGNWQSPPPNTESYNALALCLRCGCEFLIIRAPEGGATFDGYAAQHPCDVCRTTACYRPGPLNNDLPKPPATRIRIRTNPRQRILV